MPFLTQRIMRHEKSEEPKKEKREGKKDTHVKSSEFGLFLLKDYLTRSSRRGAVVNESD